ncbi:MAG: hypothetical protein JSS09_02560, partial [Verrucomicrobia bacterium]|nr:hypothetical protein [Verrucomicrobiota bacterium]
MNLNIHQKIEIIQSGLQNEKIKTEELGDPRIREIVSEALNTETWEKLNVAEQDFLCNLCDKIADTASRFPGLELTDLSQFMQTRIHLLVSLSPLPLIRRPSSTYSQGSTSIEPTTPSSNSSRKKRNHTNDPFESNSPQDTPMPSSSATSDLRRSSNSAPSLDFSSPIREGFQDIKITPSSSENIIGTPPSSPKIRKIITPQRIKASPSKDVHEKLNPEDAFRNAELRMSIFSNAPNSSSSSSSRSHSLDLSDLELETIPANLFKDALYADVKLHTDKILFMPRLNDHEIVNRELYERVLDAMLFNRAKLSDEEISNLLNLD